MTEASEKSDQQALLQMIRIFCQGKKHAHGALGAEPLKVNLCGDCAELAAYAIARYERCPVKESRSFCQFCSVHCYKPEMRARIAEVMRYSGPRMLFYNPPYALRHLCALLNNKRKQKKDREKTNAR